MAAHAGNAALAAATAASTSAGVPSGIVPMTSSVVELVTSSIPVPVLGTQAPLMKMVSRTIISMSVSRFQPASAALPSG